MREGKAVFLAGAHNTDMLGGLMCCFLTFCPDHLKKAIVDKEIRSNFTRIGLSDMSSEEYSIFGMPCENLAEADRALESLKSMDGVENAGMRILREVIIVQDWVSSEVERRASARLTE